MGKSHHVAAIFIDSFTGIHRFWLLETSWASRDSSELGWFCLLLPDSGAEGGKWWLEQALHLVRDVASAVPLGWKAALTR